MENHATASSCAAGASLIVQAVTCLYQKGKIACFTVLILGLALLSATPTRLSTGEDATPPAAVNHCDFLITEAIALPDGSYILSVQANDQTSNQSWVVTQGGIVVGDGTGPNQSWNISGGNSLFFVTHSVEGSEPCSEGFLIGSDEFCIENVVTADVENCDLEACFNIDVSSIGDPYVITFGDGSLAVESSGSQICHTYPCSGVYTVCLTYLVPETEVYVTCCYPIEIECVCPEDVIEVTSIVPCTWEATLCFDLPLPICVLSFGDGTSGGVFNDPCVTHTYPGPGTYNVCYKYEPFPCTTLVCCETIDIPGCCLDPYFELNQLLESPSCLNPMYEIINVVCPGTGLGTTHLWEFSDGTTSTDPIPPPHMFTNFLDPTGQVWVWHTITCCGQSASHTAYASHVAGAYVGAPGQQTFLSQPLNPSTTQTVLQFIQQYAGGTLPLTIDGTLVADIDATFNGGTWNMGRESEIFVQGTNATPHRLFQLIGTTIRSAVRLPNRSACCRWNGIHSERLTVISLTQGAFLMDANYGIHYPAQQGVVGSPFPAIYSIGSHYVNNYYGIKSVGQRVVFSKFLGNEMDGAPHNPQVCDCNAVNAIDFRDVNASLLVSIDPHPLNYNTIFNYEQAFHFSNTNLFVRGFNIHDLRDYQPVPGLPNNPDGDGAIGIDFRWNKSGNSSLNIDEIHFSDFEEQDAKSVAVRDVIFKGDHTLTAIAGAPLSSITTSNIAGGYDLIVNGGHVFGKIHGNEFSTNGGSNYGFGLTGTFNTGKNSLEVVDSRFSISSNAATSVMNGGVMLSGPVNFPQNFKIVGNTVDVYMQDGAGIGITNAKASIVRRNTLIKGSSDIPGIEFSLGGSGVVDCNNVQKKTNGITVESSSANRYAANYFLGNNHDLEFSLNAMGATGSNVAWNTFDISLDESIHYIGNAKTGKQHHRRYNSWQGQSGVEALHDMPINVPDCQFWHPIGAPVGSINHPQSFPSNLFIEASQTGFETILTDFCTAANDIIGLDNPSELDGEWESLVGDTAYWNALTEAEQTFMRQEIYGLLLEHPDWTNGSTILSGFKVSQSAGFVGQSESLRKAWQELLLDISDHQAAFETEYAAMASLSEQARQWLDAIYASTNTAVQDSLQNLLDVALHQSDSLFNLVQQADSIFSLAVQDSLDDLQLENADLDDSEWHTWCEKRYNQIALRWLAGMEPDSAATSDLRLIAQTCLSDGGRAVLAARGTCEAWLKEHYGEDGCLEERSADGAPSSELKTKKALCILPNPANDAIRILLEIPTIEATLQVQISNLNGQQVYAGTLTFESGALTLPVQGWHEGVYVVRLTGGSEIYTQIFVVQHR